VVCTQKEIAHISPTFLLHSYRSVHPEARGHLSEALTEDTGVGTSVAGSPLPLTTGNESLDITIVRHLQYCTQLVQVRLVTTFVRKPDLLVFLVFSVAREVRIQE
jgi:hypothetical protein